MKRTGRRNARHLDTLSVALHGNGDLWLAIDVQREAAALLPVCDSPWQRRISGRLLELLLEAGEQTAARELLRDGLAGLRTLYLPADPALAERIHGLAARLTRLERSDWAEPLLAEHVTLVRGLADTPREDLVSTLEAHAECLSRLQRDDEAARRRKEVEVLQRRGDGRS